MTDVEALDLIREAINDVAPERLAPGAKLHLDQPIETLGLDSVAALEMIGYLEERVGQPFPQEQLAKVETFGHIVSLVCCAHSGREPIIDATVPSDSASQPSEDAPCPSVREPRIGAGGLS